MFKKILIANRGEIACRVIKTCRKLGIASVAVYSDADRNALHVDMADEAVAIGPAAASESYLVPERIIEACRSTGAEAVHPGYGFLSENAGFARDLSEAGIVFIGPGIPAITAMGDKIQSKKVAQAAGVSTVPGHPDEVVDSDQALTIASDIGFPVMIKASAGGGGKGMRIAWSSDEVVEGFQLARSEAKSSFGDDRIFIEKFIVEPRHIEIQVLADQHATVTHLGVRVCSILTLNQKIIEEAPSSFLDHVTRQSMGAQAVALSKAVDYVSAGTVEFIVDRDRNFYFLEMNTRLQVEHPVTELITGLDLVEEMIRIAAGETLRIAQNDVELKGWAIESRVYAEDPARGFVPSIGRLTHYRPPEESVCKVATPSGSAGEERLTIRNDTGVFEGSEITIYYDPMIAKLCTHATGEGMAARSAAIGAMAQALDEFVIGGIRHNIGFLSALMDHPRWLTGEISTAFIAEEYPDGFKEGEPQRDELVKLGLIAAAVHLVERDRLDRLNDRLGPHPGTYQANWVVGLDDLMLPIEIIEGEIGRPLDLSISVDGMAPLDMQSTWQPGERIWRGTISGIPLVAQIVREGHAVRVSRRGQSMRAVLYRPHIADLAELMPVREVADTSRFLLCPMPGLVVSIAVKEGDTVKAGEQLAVIEAMKMENVLRAERDGVIEAVKVAPGDSLAVDSVILSFEVADQ